MRCGASRGRAPPPLAGAGAVPPFSSSPIQTVAGDLWNYSQRELTASGNLGRAVNHYPGMTLMRAIRMAVAVAFAAFSSAGAAEEVPLGPSMVPIEGGSYPIGSADGFASTRPAHSVTLDSFLIDVYEVTNLQFRDFP